MKLSTVVGKIPVQERKAIYNYNGEDFYSINIKLHLVRIELLVSEFIWSDKFFGKVSVCGYLTRADVEGSSKLFFRAVALENAPVDAEPSNEVVISGKVSRKLPYVITKNGLELQSLTVKYNAPNCKKKVGIRVVLKDGAARYYRNIEIGDDIEELYGYLKGDAVRYEVVVSSVDAIKKKEEFINGIRSRRH